MMKFEERHPVLGRMLKDIEGGEVDYFPNPGNAGDSLIAAATFQLFERHGVRVHPYTPGAPKTGTLFVGGGGNLVPLYDTTKRVILEAHGAYERIVVLPHTIRESEEFLAGLGDHCVLFCREAQSYLHVLDRVRGAQVYLEHDLALCFSPEELFADTALAARARSVYLDRLKAQKVPLERIYNGHNSCLRTDAEKTLKPEAGKNIDISKVFAHGVSRDRARLATWMLLEFVRSSALVTTNRLHVGISAAILGVKAELHDNSYGKNSQIWKHSLKGRYPSLTFAERKASNDTREADAVVA